MRIKKTSQTTPVQAQIVNTYSTSETDGYSANYINEAIKDIYSTEEKLIGIYEDKNGVKHDLYEITLEGNASTNSIIQTNWTYDIIKADVLVKGTTAENNGAYTIGYSSSTIYAGLYGNLLSGNMRIYHTLGTTAFFRVIIQYIKD